MPAKQPTIYVIAGCNGAGKTTFAKEFLPNQVKCLRFFNADEIARGLSPFAPEASAVKAARLLLEEVHDSISRRQTVALETTLSGKTYIRVFQAARKQGFQIELHYLWLSTPDLAVARVQQRVKQGGHDVPAADIHRRFRRSLVHLLDDYLPLACDWAIWDGTTLPVKQMAISASHNIEFVRSLILI